MNTKLLSVLAMSALLFGSAHTQGQPMSLTDLRRFVAQVEEQIKAAQPWAQKEGKNVVVRYVSLVPSNSPGRVDNLVNTFDRAVDLDCKTLKLDLPTRKIDIYLFPSASDLQVALHVPFAVDSGISMGYWAAIPDAPGDKLAGYAARNVGTVLVHDQIGLYGSSLISDGLSYYLEAVTSKAKWLANPRPLQKTRLRDECDGARSVPDLEEGAAFVGYLLKRDDGAPEHIKELLKALSDARLKNLRAPGTVVWPDQVEEAFKTVYGLDLDQLEYEWRTSKK